MLAPEYCDLTLLGRAGGARQLVRQRRPVRCGARARARARVRQPAPQPSIGLMWALSRAHMGLACLDPIGHWAAVGLPPDEGQPEKA